MKLRTWCRALEDMPNEMGQIPNSIQSGEFSMDGGVDGVLHISWRDSDGNLYVPYLNDWNGERNLNLNYLENDWNGNYRFLAFRNSLFHCLFLPTAKHSADFGECLA